MIELQKIQQDYKAKREGIARVDYALKQAKAKLANLNAKEKRVIKGSERQMRVAEKAKYRDRRDELSTEIEKLSADKKSLAGQLETLSIDSLSQLDPVENITELEDEFPILMFPLRLETRFKSTDNKPELWLRVYPDDCNINLKEELLSQSELTDTKSFWVEMWKAGRVEAEERGAWRSLVNSHGSGRSEWLIKQYKPENIEDKPSKPDADHKILVIISSLLLTDDEHIAARDYWAAVWLAEGNQTALTEAFETLKTAVAEARAIEIAENYIPENIIDEVPASIENQKILLEKLELPSEHDHITTQTSWTQVAKTIALPDRFVAITFSGEDKKTFLFDHPVKENLSVSPDPSLIEEEQIKKDENDDLILNDDLKWMTDFEKAVEVGMGIKIDLTTPDGANLTPEEVTKGFDKLFVVGFRFSSNETDSKALLENLLTDHFQSSTGFGLLKQGTPTNNTEDESAGYSWIEDADESYEWVFKGIEGELDENSDGQKLADSLGIDSDVLKKVANANGRDQLEATAMNTALFPATMGYFMEEMMDPLFNDDYIGQSKTFFSEFVSGRGPIPAIRIGKQPYGILPVSAYSWFKFSKKTFWVVLNNFLLAMVAKCDDMLPQVAYIGKENDPDPHQMLLDVIGLHANSVEFHQRYAQSLQQLYNQSVIQYRLEFGDSVATIIENKSKEILQNLGIIEEMGIDMKGILFPILDKIFLSDPKLLSGPLVDDVPLSEINPVRNYSDTKNYIEWLVNPADAEKIRTQNFDGKPAPNALLYLLLKHALMQSQADAATQLLVKHGVVGSKRVFFDPDLIHVEEEGAGRSKFEHLFNPNVAITGDDHLTLVEHIYKPEVLGDEASSETKQLRETIGALKVLEKTPTARLERLLVEHLDCCNYRIDAWKTGLVHSKLKEQRDINTNGLYLGAYGWLIDVKPENKELENVDLSDELNEIFNKDNDTVLQTDSKNLGSIFCPSENQAAAAAILRNAYDSNRDAGTGNQFAINLTSDRVRIANSFLEGMRNGQSLSALLGYQFERGLHDTGEEVDKFIYPLRKEFPLVADNLENTKSEATDSIETLGANNVIDGLKLINHVKGASPKTYPFDLQGLPDPESNEGKALKNEIRRIMEINDAISDLVISEQVYQVVQGNFDKASGNADAFSKGSYPPDMDIMKTPRSGTTLTQRMTIQFDATANPDLSPSTIEMTPRAKAEPSINKWLSIIFPDPKNVLCKVVYSSPIKAETEKLVSQKDLGLQPIDLLYCFDLDTEQAMTELDDRISNYVRNEFSKHPKTDLKIQYTEPVSLNDKTKISFFELAALVKSVRRILIESKFLKPSEVTLLDVEEEVSLLMDDVQLKARVDRLKEDLDPSKVDIEDIISNTKSIAKITEDFKADLTEHISELTKIEALISQLETDLKDYLTTPSVDNKAAILASFETKVKLTIIGGLGLMNELKTNLPTYLEDFLNFDDLAERLKFLLNLYITEISDVELIINQLRTDIEEYLADPDPDPDPSKEKEDEILTAFEIRLQAVEHVEIVPFLKEKYEVSLDAYLTDFPIFDTLVKNTTNSFLRVALFDNTQTGIGFIHQGISGAYDSVFSKLDKVIERWDKKAYDFEDIIGEYDPLGTPEEQFNLLQKAERIISSQSTFPLPENLIAYKAESDVQKASFDSLLVDLKALKSNNRGSLIEFFQDVEPKLQDIGNHDLISFDPDMNRNDLKAEKLMIVLLKEDIVVALNNLKTAILNKISAYTRFITESEASVINSDSIKALQNAAKQLLGEEALILPHFKLNETQANEFESSYTNSKKLLDFLTKEIVEEERKVFPVEDWLTGVSRVREKIHHWENASFLSNAFKPNSEMEVTPLQFPYQENDRWLAMKFREKTKETEENNSFEINHDKLLYTTHFAVPFVKMNAQCGIVIDEWVEVIPAKEETVGITCHYDQPNSEPPQTMLLVIPPEFTKKWKWDDVIGAMEETLEMAKKRAIEPSQIETTGFAQFLPTTMMAVTLHWITVATNLAVNNNVYQHIESN